MSALPKILAISLVCLVISQADARELKRIRSDDKSYGFRFVLDLDSPPKGYELIASPDRRSITVVLEDTKLSKNIRSIIAKSIKNIDVRQDGNSVAVVIATRLPFGSYNAIVLSPEPKSGDRLYVDVQKSQPGDEPPLQVPRVGSGSQAIKAGTGPVATKLGMDALSGEGGQAPRPGESPDPAPLSQEAVQASPPVASEKSAPLAPLPPLHTNDAQGSSSSPGREAVHPEAAKPDSLTKAPPTSVQRPASHPPKKQEANGTMKPQSSASANGGNEAPKAELPSVPADQVASLPPYFSPSLKRIMESFADKVRMNPVQAHEELAQAIISQEGAAIPEEFLHLVDRSSLPGDYIPFFADYMKSYSTLPRASERRNADRVSIPIRTGARSGSDSDVIVKFDKSDAYSAEILFLSRPQKLAAADLFGHETAFHNAIAVTGTYTSPLRYPTGLFVVRGRILNPALQRWDGMITIDSLGKIQVHDLSTLQLDGDPLNIRTNFEHYRDFLRNVAKSKQTIIQSHLLVRGGEVTVSKTAPQNKFRRRIVFSRRGGGVGIYDSGNKELSLYDAAAAVATIPDIEHAVNLDMGAYDFCWSKIGKKTRKCGAIDDTSILSNMLIIRY